MPTGASSQLTRVHRSATASKSDAAWERKLTGYPSPIFIPCHYPFVELRGVMAGVAPRERTLQR